MLNAGNRWKGGRIPKRYCYTHKDIATAKGVTIWAVRQAISRGRLNPGDLQSLCKYIGMSGGR